MNFDDYFGLYFVDATSSHFASPVTHAGAGAGAGSSTGSQVYLQALLNERYPGIGDSTPGSVEDAPTASTTLAPTVGARIPKTANVSLLSLPSAAAPVAVTTIPVVTAADDDDDRTVCSNTHDELTCGGMQLVAADRPDAVSMVPHATETPDEEQEVNLTLGDTSTDPMETLLLSLVMDSEDERRQTFSMLARIGGKDSLSNALKIVLMVEASASTGDEKPWSPRLIVPDNGLLTFPRYMEYKTSKTVPGKKMKYPSAACSTVERFLSLPGNEALATALVAGNPARGGKTNTVFFAALGERFGISASSIGTVWEKMSSDTVSPEARTVLVICALNRAVARIGDTLWASFRMQLVSTQAKYLREAQQVVEKVCLREYQLAYKRLSMNRDTRFSKKKKEATADLVPFFEYLQGGEAPTCVFRDAEGEDNVVPESRPTKRVRV